MQREKIIFHIFYSFIVIGSWPTSHTKYLSRREEEELSQYVLLNSHAIFVICCNKFNCRNSDWTKFWRVTSTGIYLQKIIIFQIPINHLIIATCCLLHVWENVLASELSAVAIAEELEAEEEGKLKECTIWMELQWFNSTLKDCLAGKYSTSVLKHLRWWGWWGEINISSSSRSSLSNAITTLDWCFWLRFDKPRPYHVIDTPNKFMRQRKKRKRSNSSSRKRWSKHSLHCSPIKMFIVAVSCLVYITSPIDGHNCLIRCVQRVYH